MKNLLILLLSLSLTAHGQVNPMHNVVRDYVESFNRYDEELYPQFITNDRAAEFLLANVPLFECPDKELERIYYFRWWTFRKHIRQTAEHGFVITEFLPPVNWAGPENVISCPAGHHYREGRWLHDQRYLNDYTRFWLTGPANEKAIRSYSFWIADCLIQQSRVTGDEALARELLHALIDNYNEWVKMRRDPNGLFWQRDIADGMEDSSAYGEFGGEAHSAHHYRVTINSYMAADALAIASLARRSGDLKTAEKFQKEAGEILTLRDSILWDADADFYKVAYRGASRKSTLDSLRFNTDRELIGYVPWYFDNTMPAPDRDIAWRQLGDRDGFRAPYGPTTCEQRGKFFRIAYSGRWVCQWNGPTWPFATSQTLTALDNLINARPESQDFTRWKSDWLETLNTYARSHKLCRDDGILVPWIDENINPLNGDWISRTRKKARHILAGTTYPETGKDYNHSAFCDHIITGIVGLRPSEGDTFTVNPIIPDTWEWFRMENIPYHGRILTIFYDKTGNKYKQGAGLHVFLDGSPLSTSAVFKPLTCALTDR